MSDTDADTKLVAADFVILDKEDVKQIESADAAVKSEFVYRYKKIRSFTLFINQLCIYASHLVCKCRLCSSAAVVELAEREPA